MVDEKYLQSQGVGNEDVDSLVDIQTLGFQLH